MRFRAIVLILCLVVPAVLHARTLYKCISDEGTVYLGDTYHGQAECARRSVDPDANVLQSERRPSCTLGDEPLMDGESSEPACSRPHAATARVMFRSHTRGPSEEAIARTKQAFDKCMHKAKLSMNRNADIGTQFLAMCANILRANQARIVRLPETIDPDEQSDCFAREHCIKTSLTEHGICGRITPPDVNPEGCPDGIVGMSCGSTLDCPQIDGYKCRQTRNTSGEMCLLFRP